MTPSFSRRRVLAALPLLALAPRSRAQAGFDHTHAEWTALLARHVIVLRGGQASQVRYAGFAADRPALRAYLSRLSSVRAVDFAGYSGAEQQAFLVNAYNAFTVELILGAYPEVASIRDLGGFLGNPWRRKWVPLLGENRSLDDIEHRMLRERGRYDEPRVHFAVNCASIGCPALREEAFVASRLEAQLEQQTARFMADRSRNRYDTRRGRLEVSKIFDWYGEDFRLGHRGITSLPDFMARHAERLADAPAERQRILARQADISFLDYDWRLNDAR